MFFLAGLRGIWCFFAAGLRGIWCFLLLVFGEVGVFSCLSSVNSVFFLLVFGQLGVFACLLSGNLRCFPASVRGS